MEAPQDYAEAPLPKTIRRRVEALKNLQQNHRDIERKFHEELLAIERKYVELYSPLYRQRTKIVAGEYEPSEEECKPVLSERDKDEDKEDDADDAEDAPEGVDIKGIPGFWLQCLKNHPGFRMNIMERDEEALRHLDDVKLSYLIDQYGFKFDFLFSENPFFTNKVLTKTYYLSLPSGSSQEDYSFDRSEGCTIDWKEEKNLTVKIEAKKQRHKGTNRTRIVKRQVPQESFFSFFSPPKMPEDADVMLLEEIQDLRDNLDSDFDLGEELRTKIVPNAVGWFTGDAAADFLLDDELGEDDDELFEDESEEDEDDEEEEVMRSRRKEAAV